MRPLLAAALVLLALAPVPWAAAEASHTVSASNLVWTPSSLTIAVGESVRFVSVQGTHSWVRDDGSDACALPCERAFLAETTVAYHCGIHPSMMGRVVVATAPSIAVDAPREGDVVDGLIEVSGTSQHAQSVAVRLGAGDLVSAALAADGSWTASLDTAGLPNGAVLLVARATSAGGLAREASVGVLVENPPFYDAAVTSLVARQDATSSNDLVFHVRNEGNVVQPAVLARAEYLHDGAWRPIGETTLAPLAAGGSVAASIVWRPAAQHLGGFDVRVTVDPEDSLLDVQRADNARTARAAWVSPFLPGIVAPVP